MSTAVYDVATSIKARRLEVDTLLAKASTCDNSSRQLYNYLCRASCVLIASHLEGFLKDLTRSLLLDFNYYRASFQNMPVAMKRTFCEKIAFYEGAKKDEIESRIRQLIAFFDINSVPIQMDAFSYKKNLNKNPSSEFIDVSFGKIGVPCIVYSISNGPFDSIFDNDNRTNVLMLREITRLRSHLFKFPYRRLPSKYEFNYSPPKNMAVNTIWHAFIEDVMQRRHSIAHGETMENTVTHTELLLDMTKIDVLMHGLMYSAVSYLSK